MGEPTGRPLRIELDAPDVGTGFAQLVVTVMELIRELLERQALRRVEAGDLTDEQVERLGAALRDIAYRMAELRSLVQAEPGEQPPRAAPSESPAIEPPDASRRKS